MQHIRTAAAPLSIPTEAGGVEVNRHAQLDLYSHTETAWAGIHLTLGCHMSLFF